MRANEARVEASPPKSVVVLDFRTLCEDLAIVRTPFVNPSRSGRNLLPPEVLSKLSEMFRLRST